MAITKFSPGQTIVIEYTSKGYAVTIAGAKVANSAATTKYYANLDLLLSDSSLNLSTSVSGNDTTIVSASTGNLSVVNTKKNRLYDGLGYHESVRPYNENVTLRSDLPGYKNAYFEFKNINTGEIVVVGFVVSPNSISHSYSTVQQISKTMSGWNIMRNGSNLHQITMNGYMLDTKYCQERHDFIERYYKQYVEDKKDANNEYVNDWAVSLIVEGKKYMGFFASLSMQKSSVHPFLYQYSIGFYSVKEVLIYYSAKAIANRRKMVAPDIQKVTGKSGFYSDAAIGSQTGGLLGIL